MRVGRGRIPFQVLNFLVAALGTARHDLFNLLTEGLLAIGHHRAGFVPISLADVGDLLAVRADNLDLDRVYPGYAHGSRRQNADPR